MLRSAAMCLGDSRVRAAISYTGHHQSTGQHWERHPYGRANAGSGGVQKATTLPLGLSLMQAVTVQCAEAAKA